MTGEETTTAQVEHTMDQPQGGLVDTMAPVAPTPKVPGQTQLGLKTIHVSRTEFAAEPVDQGPDTVARVPDLEVVDLVNNDH